MSHYYKIEGTMTFRRMGEPEQTVFDKLEQHLAEIAGQGVANNAELHAVDNVVSVYAEGDMTSDQANELERILKEEAAPLLEDVAIFQTYYEGDPEHLLIGPGSIVEHDSWYALKVIKDHLPDVKCTQHLLELYKSVAGHVKTQLPQIDDEE